MVSVFFTHLWDCEVKEPRSIRESEAPSELFNSIRKSYWEFIVDISLSVQLSFYTPLFPSFLA